jgi:hypothetical protein
MAKENRVLGTMGKLWGNPQYYPCTFQCRMIDPARICCLHAKHCFFSPHEGADYVTPPKSGKLHLKYRVQEKATKPSGKGCKCDVQTTYMPSASCMDCNNSSKYQKIQH